MTQILTLLCAHCLMNNRIARPRLKDAPKCGNCSSALTPGTPMNLDSKQLERAAVSDGLPFVVDFWASWSGPRLPMESTVTTLAADFHSLCRFFTVNMDDDPQIAAKLGIRNIPTMILYRDGNIVSRRSGVTQLSHLRLWLNDSLQTNQTLEADHHHDSSQ